jgi:recombination protein RecR
MAKVEYPAAVQELVTELKRLPGVGPRSAERIAVWLLQSKRAEPLALAKALERAESELCLCAQCGFFATAEHCLACDETKRDASVICVVEQPTDVLPMERSGSFRVVYHCLGGRLSPLDHVTPEDLRIEPLMRRATEGVEIILALGSDVEGETTAHYLAGELRGRGCRITRIAQGLPAGGGLEHADELTLMRAMQGRREWNES